MGLSSNDKISSKTCLKEDGVITFDPKTNAGIFKNFYYNSRNKFIKTLTNATNKSGIQSVKAYYKNRNLASKKFSFTQVTEDTILQLLLKVNPSKPAGIDKLGGKFLKDGAPILKVPITQLCNLSISLSAFPQNCKVAKIKPIFKKGLSTEPQNYRPISLLPLISKIMEKVIHYQTQSFLMDNNILYKYQSGFHGNHSTASCLSYVNNKMIEGFDAGQITGMILIDLQKAFDTIDHKILLDKLTHLGFYSQRSKYY